ncbi:MAG: SEC-C domain-containing protein [Candidatus Diapherotrites archaeon]
MRLNDQTSDIVAQESAELAAFILSLEQSKKKNPDEYPAKIEKLFEELFGPIYRGKAIGRNDKCWCGSGKKFKKCCMDKMEKIEDTPFEFKEFAVKNLLKKPPKTLSEIKSFQRKLSRKSAEISGVPSAAKMIREKRFHYKEIFSTFEKFLETKEFEDTASQLDKIKIDKDPFVEKAEKTGEWKNVLMEVEALKAKNGEEWALDNQYNILAKQFPGFEYHLNEIFFRKCAVCERKDKEELACEYGHAECLYNDEYEEFTKKFVESIVGKLKNGEHPEELNIPQRLAGMELKFQEIFDKAKERVKGG